MPYELSDEPKRVGFVATRIAGTDGVSLEIGKWANVLEQMGHMVEHNYEVARQYFSYARLEAELRTMLAKPRFATRHGESTS